MNKILRLTVILAMIWCSQPLLARDFEYTYEGQTLTYTVLDEEAKTVEVSKCGRDAYSVQIPSIVNDGNYEYSVVSIGALAFSNTYIRDVIIPPSVVSIDHDAFFGCFLYKSAYPNHLENPIPSEISMISIPYNAETAIFEDGVIYEDESKLVYTPISLKGEYTISSSITSIGDYAFAYDFSLNSVVIPSSVVYIGQNAFYECEKLKKLAYPNTVENPFPTAICVPYDPSTAIFDDGFIYSTELELIYAPSTYSGQYIVPNAIISIGDSAFARCEKLTAIDIPNSVTSIGDKAFYDCSSLTSVTIPNSVTSIGNSAFYYCSRLTSVTIPNSVTSIGNSAFYSCSRLTSVTIPNSVTSIGNSAFAGCYELTSIDIPNSVTSIGDNAFNACSSLTSVTIPNSVIEIGYYAFSYCRNLTSINIPDSVTAIGEGVFLGCGKLVDIVIGLENQCYTYSGGLLLSKNLDTLIKVPLEMTSVNIPKSVKSIGIGAFYNCLNLTSVTIPNSVTSIGDNAFYGCGSLTSVTIPNSVTSIGDNAFYGCGSLTSVTIPNSVTSIGDNAFGGCSSLLSIVIPNSITSIGDFAFAGSEGLISIDIPNSVTSIGRGAFSGCKSLMWVEIPNSITIIENNTFLNCNNLRFIKIPDSVTSIDYFAFGFCRGLESVELSNSLISIGYNAFTGCSRLASVVIPNSVTSIGYDAFSDCNNLIKSAYPDNLENSFPSGISIPYNAKTAIFEDGCIFEPGSALLFAPISLTGEYTVPNTVTSIGEYAFYDCNTLTSVVIPNSVTSIGGGAFLGCNNLIKSAYPNHVENPFPSGISIPYHAQTAMFEDGIIYEPGSALLFAPISLTGEYTVPNTVTSIGDNAFYGCNTMTSVSIPNSVTSIGNNTFSGCSELTSVEIPNSVTSIGDNAFYGCKAMTSVSIPNSVTSIGNNTFSGCSGLTSVEIPNSVTSIGDNAFYGCKAMISVSISNSVTSIGNNTFSGCSGLTSVEIPNSVSSIGNNAFFGCDELTSVSIPGSVTSIGNEAFAGCKGLTTIYSYNTTPPTTVSNTFNEVPYDAIVYVPKGRALAYSNHSGWKAFYDFREMGALTISLNKNSLDLKVNETEILVSNIGNPENAGIKSEEWTSTNPAVATVDNGVVTAVSVGTATINFIVTDEYGATYYASCAVSVTIPSAVDSIPEDETGDTEIYTLNGVKVNGPADHLAPGTYIVKKGNKVSKIMVK